MMRAVFSYQFRLWMGRPITYILAAAFYGITLFIFLGTAGFFDDYSTIQESAREFYNSPHLIQSYLRFIGKGLLMLLPAVVGTSIYDDFKTNFFPLLYTSPIHKNRYLASHFSGSFLIVLLISLTPGAALITGEWILSDTTIPLGPFSVSGYLQGYLLFLIPNLACLGIIIFTVVALARNVFAGYFLLILFFLISVVAENLFTFSPLFSSLIDPFGDLSAEYSSLSSAAVPESNPAVFGIPVLAANRLLYQTLTLLSVLFLFRYFKLSQYPAFATQSRSSRAKQKTAKTKSPGVGYSIFTENYPHLYRLVYLIRWKTGFLIRNKFFLFSAAAIVISLLFILSTHTIAGLPPMQPLTRSILYVPSILCITMVTPVTFILSGMLTWYSEESGMWPLTYATPAKNSLFVLSDILTLFLIQGIFLLLFMVTGMGFQIYHGWFDLNITQYLFHITFMMAPVLITWTLLSVFAHTIIQNFYAALFLLVFIWMGTFGFDQIGIQSRLFRFNTYAALPISDLNGYGHLIGGELVLRGYWIISAFILIPLTLLLFNRERWFNLSDLVALIRIRFSIIYLLTFSVLLLSLSIIGFTIHREEARIYTPDLSPGVWKHLENRFEHLSGLPQPQISSVALQVDIFPDEHRFEAAGSYTLINRTAQSVDTLIVKNGFDELTTHSLSVPAVEIMHDSLMQAFVYQLENPIMPDDSIRLDFRVKNSPNTLFQQNSSVLTNGTFINDDILPRIGYFFPQSPSNPADPGIRNVHYQSIGSGRVDADIVISTSSDQVALANGEKLAFRRDGERNIYHYKPSEPVKFSFFFISGRYEVAQDQWRHVDIELYHHPAHEQNAESILAGIKASLELNSSLFGSLAEKEKTVRAVELPLQAGDLMSFKTNTLLLSEPLFGVQTGREVTVGTRSSGGIDFPFYIASHEMTHYWFGNRLLPKRALGATVLTESLTEYLSLELIDNEFGENERLRFLKLQHDRYLRGHNSSDKTEPPLSLAQVDQEYITYGKGAVVFNALSRYIGRERFLNLLSKFHSDYSDKHSVYPTTLSLKERISEALPDSLKFKAYELLDTVTLHDASIVSAALLHENPGSYLTKIEFEYDKRTDGKIAPLRNDIIDLVLYDELNEIIAHEFVVVEMPVNQIQLRSQRRPFRVEVDPGLLLIDTDRSNNSQNVRQNTPRVDNIR